MRPTPPFVLFDDARSMDAAPARLYEAPVAVVEAMTLAEVRPALERLRAARADGLHAAGYLTYEAGAALAARALPAMGEGRLLWFGLFERYREIADAAALLPDPAGAWSGVPQPSIDRARYDAQVARVLALIRAGDLYQANLTHPVAVPVAGDSLALYARWRTAARAGWGALVATGTDTILSFSPELFFALREGRLTCRPMKGTARRAADRAADRAAAAALAGDAKERAENLMIVDLMRNDLSRIAHDVAASDLFTVETYPTVHQLVSTVTATLDPGRDAIDVIAALFPCGSITGAPKQRAMEVIAEVEDAARGVYCGAIGRLDAGGDAQFNVAIRTLTIPPDSRVATGGAGGGIVADSLAAREWDEARAKTEFLRSAPPGFDLIETMAFDPEAGIARIERHLARMRASAARFGFRFDRHHARNELQAATFRLRAPARIRLLLAPSGALAIEVGPMPPAPAGPVPVTLAALPVPAGDLRLRHKTSDRGFYDCARQAFEVVFTRDGLVTEGSFTNVFVERDGLLLTPPRALGLLPGVLRGELIDSGAAREAPLAPADLAGGFLLGNAVRGLFAARLAGDPRDS